MARPERNTVDYFPFLCDDGKKMFYIEETYGNDGFATFIKILRELAKTNHHYLDLSKKTTMMFLSAKCKVSVSVLESIIDDLAELGKFDDYLWSQANVVWCQDFIDSIQDAYKKRNNKCIDKKQLLDLLHSKGVLKQSKSTSKPLKCESEAPVNPQRKEKDSIVKEIKVKKGDTDFTEFEDLDNPPEKKSKRKVALKEKESEAELWPTFEDFWNEYDKKRGLKDKVEEKWNRLKHSEKEQIMAYIPDYILSQPDKQFRKDPATFLNNRSWEDEIIIPENLRPKLSPTQQSAFNHKTNYPSGLCSKGRFKSCKNQSKNKSWRT